MLFRYYGVLILFEIFRSSLAVNPFSGELIKTNCYEEWQNTGCNETLLEANCSVSDKTMYEGDTRFYLFTRHNRNKPEFLHKRGGRLAANTNFRSKCKTVIFSHGFLLSSCEFAAIRELKDQFLYRGNYNFIIVDWPDWVRFDYATAVGHAKIVGKQIALLIQNIMCQTGAKAKKFHLIGNSLGAHIVGFAGKFLQELVGKKVSRITGLDPAGPAFQTNNTAERLDRNDAEWVDVIHTNGGKCLPDFGTLRALGHADFYCNGGSEQFSAIIYAIESIFKGDVLYGVGSLIPPEVGSHAHSYQYFKVSVNACDCQFIGVECDSFKDFESGKCGDCGEDGSKCAVMGMDWECYPRKKGSHKYFLNTSLLCPYCKNEGINLRGFNESLRTCSCKARCFEPSKAV